MKKILLIGSILLLLYLCNYKEYNNYEETIRFRVIANSNSSKDILMKEKIVKELSTILFKDLSYEETNNNIYNNLKKIEDRINILFKNNNYNKKFNISYGLNEFPEKKYKGKIYKKGLYKSLVVSIGESKGNNYFCILYPSLCTIDDLDNKENYKFKIVELIKDIF